MEFCLITDQNDFAIEAEAAGVERIMIDLEKTGKAQRQSGRGLFISEHSIESAFRMKGALKDSSLVVRVNALTSTSDEEIEAVIESGADYIMLPYFHSIDEVRNFLALVSGRAKTILLVETKSAVEILPDVISESGFSELYIGLNDLSISMGHKVIFEPLCNGMIDRLSTLIREEGIPFGFGGIGRLSRKGLPVDPERILAEQVRLRASVGWLGRSFREDIEYKRRAGELAAEIKRLREVIKKWESSPKEAFARNRKGLMAEVAAWKASLNV
ncbi:MAG TPA: aldolase/citrate lyase family protein [Blastocatellia bacterium]|nr:aldolase/citrate lyase family protein [Blastocatellia bacterium]